MWAFSNWNLGCIYFNEQIAPTKYLNWTCILTEGLASARFWAHSRSNICSLSKSKRKGKWKKHGIFWERNKKENGNFWPDTMIAATANTAIRNIMSWCRYFRHGEKKYLKFCKIWLLSKKIRVTRWKENNLIISFMR